MPENPREREVRERLAQARALPTSDVKAKIAAYAPLIPLSEGMSIAREIREDYSALVDLRRKQFAREVSSLRDRAGQLLSKEQFQAAIDLVEQERAKTVPPDDPDRLREITAELRQEIDRAFMPLQEKATAALRQNNATAFAAIRDQIALWGVKEKLQEFDSRSVLLPTSSESPGWREVFHGRSLECLQEGGKGWNLEDGAIVNVEGQEVAGRTKEEYTDGELRIRFESKGLEELYFKIRQGHGGGYAWDITGQRLRTLGDGPHELVFTAKGAEVTATLDEHAVKLSIEGPAAKGCLQFIPRGGTLRILSIDAR